jgi:glucose-6-phosphate isomerase
MQLQFFNAPQPEAFRRDLLPGEKPAFVSYVPNWDLITKTAKEYKNYTKIIIVGHGGSITSFYAMYQAFESHATKKAYFVSTVDPDYIADIREATSPEDTLVIAVTKSGENTTQVEALMHFTHYPLVFITGSGSPVEEIAKKLQAKIITHPPIGGRYTGLTEVALVPAALCGFDVQAMYTGANKFYEVYERDNLAWRAASVLNQLEEKGYVDVFMPFYSHRLFGFSSVIVQLCHESFGKAGEGQTYIASEAPESQHHTNQRFFGGRKNMAGFFTSVDIPEYDLTTEVPTSIQSVSFKEQHLVVLHKIPLQAALLAELKGTMDDAKANGIPLAHMSLASVTSETVGSLLGFWQLYGVYASLLRGVNPFDQPQVESSKIISFKERLKFKGVEG